MSLPTMPRSAAPYSTYVGMSAGFRKMKRRSRDTAESSWSAGSRSRPLGSANVNGAAISLNPLDAGAQRLELLLKRLVAAIQVIDARDHGGAPRREPGQHERGGRPQVGRHDGRALIGRHAAHDGGGAFRLDPRAHATQLGRVHEPVLEDG